MSGSFQAARNTARQGSVVNDTFAHNTRSELVEATVNNTEYQYGYDNIGNRLSSTEGDNTTTYMSNNLNQYTSIQEASEAAFAPQFDADGNQILIKTETGIWSAVYNAENRPVTFTNSESNTVVECAYDSMGRRAYKKVTVNGEVTLHQRYIYRGYLQIACIDLTRTAHPALWYITWDPTESPRGLGGGLEKPRSVFAPQGRAGNGVPASQPVATRPLAIQINGTWHTYGWDLTKNICELYSTSGTISTTYTYAPFGLPSQSTNGAAAGLLQPIQWSSEVWDAELGLVYYNWRYYASIDGQWLQRDPYRELSNNNLYLAFINSPNCKLDFLGLADIEIIVVRTYHKVDTTSVWTATSNVEGCASVSGVGIELKDGKYRLKKHEKYCSPDIEFPCDSIFWTACFLLLVSTLRVEH